MNKKIQYAIIIFIIIFGLWFRLRDLGRSGFWLDEIFSINIARQSLYTINNNIPLDKPPLDYFIMHFFLKIKESEFMARLPSAIYGTLTVLLIFLITKKIICNDKYSFIYASSSALFAATSAMYLRYSQEARPYALVILFICFSMYYFLDIIQKEKPSKSSWWLLFIFSALGIFTLYTTWIFLFLNLLFLTLMSLFLKFNSKENCIKKNEIKRIILYFIILLALVLLMMPYYGRIAKTPSTKVLYDFDLKELKWIIHYTNIFGVMYVESQAFDLIKWNIPGSVLFLPFALIGIIYLFKKDRHIASYMLLQMLGLLLIPIVAFYFMNHFMSVRYIVPATIPYIIFLGIGCVVFMSFVLNKILRYKKDNFFLLFIPILILCSISFIWIMKNPSKRAEWRDFINYVEKHSTPQTALVGMLQCDSVCPRYYVETMGLNLPVYEVNDDLNAILEIKKNYPHLFLYTVGPLKNKELMEYLTKQPQLSKKYYQIFAWHTIPYTEYFKFEDVLESAITEFENKYLLDFGDETFGFIGSGWEPAEKNETETFRWANSIESDIVMCLSSPDKFEMDLRAEPFVYPNWKGQSAEVIINDLNAAEIEFNPGMNNYKIILDKNIWQPGVNIIKFRFKNINKISEVIPESNDNRNVTVRFDYIKFKRM